MLLQAADRRDGAEHGGGELRISRTHLLAKVLLILVTTLSHCCFSAAG
jgi:hypothetical protein